MDDNLIFGELNPNGSIKRDVRICAISGQPVEHGDALIVVPNTGRFYRVKAPLMWPQNQAAFQEAKTVLEARIAPAAPAVADVPAMDATSEATTSRRRGSQTVTNQEGA